MDRGEKSRRFLFAFCLFIFQRTENQLSYYPKEFLRPDKIGLMVGGSGQSLWDVQGSYLEAAEPGRS